MVRTPNTPMPSSDTPMLTSKFHNYQITKIAVLLQCRVVILKSTVTRKKVQRQTDQLKNKMCSAE